MVADTLSRIPITVEDKHTEELFLNRRVFEDSVTFPLDFSNIARLQKGDKQLERLLKDGRTKNKFQNQNIQGHNLWVMSNKELDTITIFVPSGARSNLIKWFHENLNHVGGERTAGTLKQHFAWPGLTQKVKDYIKSALYAKRGRSQE